MRHKILHNGTNAYYYELFERILNASIIHTIKLLKLIHKPIRRI